MAKAYIVGLLAHGDVLSDVVLAKGEKAGFPEATMKRAKSNLGIKSEKRGKVWYWVLKSNQGVQVAQESQEVLYGNGALDPLDTLPSGKVV